MAVPSNRVPVRVARGLKAALDANLVNLLEGEIVYAKDEDQLYVVEGGVLVAMGADLATSVLGDLSDVSAVAATDGQILTWNNTAGEWEAADAPAVGLTIQERAGVGGAITNPATSITTLSFNPNNGFSVTDLGAGEALVELGSSFAPWHVAGQDSLTPTGEEPLEVIAGTGIVITTNNASTPKSITFTSTGGGVSTLDGLTDVNVSNAVTGDLISATQVVPTESVILNFDVTTSANDGLGGSLTELAAVGVALDAAVKKFGASSARFDDGATTTGARIELDNNAAFDLSGDFTIETWVRLTNANGTNPYSLVVKRVSNFNQHAYSWFYNPIGAGNSGKMQFTVGSGTNGTSYYSDAINIPADSWVHLAVTNVSGDLTFYYNGVASGTAVAAGNNATTNSQLFVGNLSAGSTLTEATFYMDQVALTKSAKYTTNFTPAQLLGGQTIWNAVSPSYTGRGDGGDFETGLIDSAFTSNIYGGGDFQTGTADNPAEFDGVADGGIFA